MKHNKHYLFDFDDILIEPAVYTDIISRKEIDIIDKDFKTLPLMTAPMDTVIDKNNLKYFLQENIVPVLPRIKDVNENYYSTSHFLSYSMEQFTFVFLDNHINTTHKIYALIDVANGHMSKLYDIAKKAKKKYGDKLYLMVGNVAHPKAFLEYCEIGVDAVRIGIGNGNGCLTSYQTGIGYSMGSLIKQCYEIRPKKSKTKIIADGGFKKYSDIIKGLALGADYIMLGSILNKALESAGPTYKREILDTWVEIDQYSIEAKQMFNSDIPLVKSFRGMSTKEVQKDWGKKVLTTSEGVVKKQNVEYTLNGWTTNFKDYLRSAMSYTNSNNLEKFKGDVKCNFITQNSLKRFDK